MTPPAPVLGRIGQIAIRVHDVARATEFYRDRLGLPHLFSAPSLAFFDAGGVRLMLGPAEKPELDHASSILYFEVADIDAAHRTLLDRGVRFEGAPHVVARLGAHDLWMAFFYDSEDNMLSMMSQVPAK
jgi:predicted enzyme related to lactoylglutathione lyase